MQLRRRILTAGTTFFLAAATGHVMQNGDAIQARLRGAPPPAPERTEPRSVDGIVFVSLRPELSPRAREAALATSTAGRPALPATPFGGVPALPGGKALAGRMAGLERGADRPLTAPDSAYDAFGWPVSAGG